MRDIESLQRTMQSSWSIMSTEDREGVLENANLPLNTKTNHYLPFYEKLEDVMGSLLEDGYSFRHMKKFLKSINAFNRDATLRTSRGEVSESLIGAFESVDETIETMPESIPEWPKEDRV